MSQFFPGFPFNPFVASGMFLAALVMWVVVLLIISALLMWLWNITITKIFGLREITFWEAFRLLIITGILFGKGFGFNYNF